MKKVLNISEFSCYNSYVRDSGHPVVMVQLLRTLDGLKPTVSIFLWKMTISQTLNPPFFSSWLGRGGT